MRFGKHAPKNDYRTLHFPTYTANLAAPPPTFSNTDRVIQKISGTIQTLFPMDGNDVEGCCTIAGIAHGRTVYSGVIGKQVIPSAVRVHKIYRHLSGGEDTGLNMLDVLNYWRKNAAFDEKLVAFAKLDPRNHTHVQQAISTFGGVYCGFQVQENCIKDFEAGKIWMPGKLTQDGHAIFVPNYDGNHLGILTWGSIQSGSWAWWDECVDECYVLLPVEAHNKDFAPGFDFKTLAADLNDVAN